ncbi:MAG: NAD-dependent succinate-semialdehyde dehydrogenase [Pseudomonadota bacterium]
MSGTLTTINPTTGETIKQYEMMSDSEVDQTLARCQEAFRDWGMTSLEQRAEAISAIGNELRKSADDMAPLMTKEMGKLVKQSHQEIELCAAICDYTARTGPDALADEHRDIGDGKRGIVTYSPIGLLYGIQPWNFPAYQVVRYAIANLMAGNGVLLKHAESVTGSGLFLRDVFERAGLQEHLFSVLLISHEQSDGVIDDNRVRGVTMTGSSAAGSKIAAKAGVALKKTVLELGSNDAYLVLADADLDQAVKVCVQGRIYNNGETCIAAKRFIVVDEIYDAFSERFIEAMSQVRSGDPMGDDADIGPMAREDLRDTLHEQVEKSISQGARARCGGELPSGPGFFYPATVLDELEPGMPAYEDELFGPVASLIRAKDEDDAMRIANESRFGLGGGILSSDVDRAIGLARDHFNTGMVFVNGFGLATPNMPFGGVKDSGYGREHGGFGMKEFVNVKAITVSE